MSDGEATKTLKKTQSPAVQGTQDQKAMDNVSAIISTRMEDGRITEVAPKTQDSPTPAKAETLDEPTGDPKLPFHMMPSAFVSLLMRVMGYKGRA